MGVFNSDGSVNSSFRAAPTATRNTAQRTPIDWGSVAAQADQQYKSEQMAKKKADIQQYLATQKNAPAVKAASPDLFGSTGFGHILSHISNAATAVARIPASIVGSTAEGVLGTGSAGGDVPQAQKAQVVKNEQAGKQSTNVKPANTGKAQSVGSEAAGALSARFLVAAPAEKFIQEYVGSKIPGLAGEVTAKAAATAHQAGLVNALGTAADPNATHADVMKSYATGVAAGLGLGAGGKLLGAGVKGVAEKLSGDSGGGEVAAPKPVVPNRTTDVPAGLHPATRNVFDETLPTAAGDVKGAPLARDFVASVYHGLGAQTAQLAKGLKPENIKLIDQIESDKPMNAAQAAAKVQEVASKIEDPAQRQQFLAVVDSMKQGKDTRYLGDKAGLGRDLGYVQNHLTHVYEHSGAPGEFTPENPVPGYTKNRIIATKAQAEALSKETNPDGSLKYPQLKLADVNAVEAHVMSMNAAAAEHGDEAFRQGIAQAHPGAVVGNKANGLYSKIMLPNGTDIASVYNKRMSPTSAKFPYGVRTSDGQVLAVKDGNVVKALKDNPGSQLINAATGENLHSNKISRIVRSVKTNPIGAYDKANNAVKTSVLGGGTFHALTTAGTVAGQQTIRAITHPTQIPKAIVENLRIVGGTFNKTQHESNMAGFTERGVTDFSKKVGATLGTADGLGTDVSHVRVPVIAQIHDAIFNRQIPEAKLTIMEQAMRQKFGKDVNFDHPTPEQITYGRDVASAVNNLGGINRAIEGLTPRTARVVSRVVLAPDYTEGKFRTIYNALSKGGPKGNIARQMVVGKSVLFALPGLVALTAAGKIDWNDPKSVESAIVNQFLDPQVGLGFNGQASKTNPGGTPQSVHLPTTFVSELGKVFKPMFGGPGTDKLSGLKSYATNRVAALPGAAAKLAQNKDYYGNPIYGSDAAGNPLGATKTGFNLASLLGPIPVAQAAKQATGQQHLESTILNTLGGRVSADTNSTEAGNSKEVNQLYSAFKPASDQSAAVRKQVQTLISQNKVNQAHRVAQDFNTRLQSFNRNYPAGQGTQNKAAWDAKWKSLEIKTSSRADQTRAKNAKTNATLLNLSQ